MKATTHNTQPDEYGCVPNTAHQTDRELTGVCDHFRRESFFMVIEEYLMMCRDRSQTYKDIGDPEACRERITREVSSLP